MEQQYRNCGKERSLLKVLMVEDWARTRARALISEIMLLDFLEEWVVTV